MKYIEKLETPQFFIDDTKELNKWNEYRTKRELKEFILENEQNYLCGYCEAKINLNNSHLEHIEPKSNDYSNLTFNYDNLIVSCQGNCESEDNKHHTCGHKKANEFSRDEFLNPTKQKYIREYFIYENGFIKTSIKDSEKAIYTINLLQLNSENSNLIEARKKALTEFRDRVKKNAIKNKKPIKEIAIILLNRENLAFISFLKFHFQKFTKDN